MNRVIVLRLIVATLSALALADCGGMHACTADGVPCGESAARSSTLARGSGGGLAASPLPLAPAPAPPNEPFILPVFAEPAPAPEPPLPPAPVATGAETTRAPAEDEETSDRHHGRHHRRGHRGGHHRSGGSHSRHHRRH